MTKINIYLTFNGNCEQAFNYYRSVFGGEFMTISRFGEMPSEEGQVFPEEEKDRIMHVSLPISEASVLMGSDTGGEWAKGFRQGNNFSISVDAESRENADDLFGKLSNEGMVIMPMDNTFWDSYFGMCTDKFGINWMVSFSEDKKH